MDFIRVFVPVDTNFPYSIFLTHQGKDSAVICSEGHPARVKIFCAKSLLRALLFYYISIFTK